jgi:hypothetical protein
MEIRGYMSFFFRLLMGSTEANSKPEPMSGEEFARSINLINATQFVIPCLRTKAEKKATKAAVKISEETPGIQNRVNSEEIIPVSEEKPLKRVLPWLF